MLIMFLAPGFEETEAIAVLDVLRRAGLAASSACCSPMHPGLDVRTVGIGGREITSCHGITVRADLMESELLVELPDGVILPGGMPGMENLAASDTVRRALAEVSAAGGLLAAICAAPAVLGRQGYLRGKRATCFPGYEPELAGAVVTDGNVVRDGNVITARGAGVSLEFGAAIADYFLGAGAGSAVLERMQY